MFVVVKWATASYKDRPIYQIARMHYHLLFVLFALPAIQGNVNQCGSKKLKDCVCGKVITPEKKVVFAVNCTNLGFNNTEMLQELPKQTQYLIFTGNHVPVLPVNIFGEFADLPLQVIDMSNNGIREIKGKTFHHVTDVERLILNHNDISISSEFEGNYHHPRVFSNFYNLQELHLTNAFADNTDAALADDLHDIFVNSNLTKLFKIHLEQNEIKRFKDQNVFCDLPDIHDIHLGDNNIPSVNFNLKCLRKLRYLDLENNNITKFSQQDLDSFDALASPRRSQNLILEIEGNPFRCDQAVKNLYNWLHNTHVEVRNKDRLACHQAKYGQKYIMNLKTLAEAKHAKVSQAITVLLIVLVVIFITLLFAYAYLKKDRLKSKFGPILDTFTKKVHYTTIESQDV